MPGLGPSQAESAALPSDGRAAWPAAGSARFARDTAAGSARRADRMRRSVMPWHSCDATSRRRRRSSGPVPLRRRIRSAVGTLHRPLPPAVWGSARRGCTAAAQLRREAKRELAGAVHAPVRLSVVGVVRQRGFAGETGEVLTLEGCVGLPLLLESAPDAPRPTRRVCGASRLIRTLPRCEHRFTVHGVHSNGESSRAPAHAAACM